jgi:hypothetical protein
MTGEPQLIIVGGKKRGRPPATVPKERRTFYVPPAYLDRIDRLALKHGLSSNEALCKVVDMALRMPRADFPDSNK